MEVPKKRINNFNVLYKNVLFVHYLGVVLDKEYTVYFLPMLVQRLSWIEHPITVSPSLSNIHQNESNIMYA